MKIRLFWVVFFMSSALNSAQNTFMMGSKQVMGYSSVYRGCLIYQPLVTPQTGNSCGYHAVFNAQGFLQCLQGLDFDFMSAQARGVLFGTDQAPWKAFVLERDPLYASGDLVEADVLDQMAQRFFPGIQNNFAVFDNDQNFLGQRNARFNSINPKQKQQNLDTFFREVQQYIAAQTPCSYAFFINTANAFAGEVQQDAHWVMLLFYKGSNGVHTYYLADSTNQNITSSPFVTALIDRIERPLPPVASSSSTTTQTRFPLKKEQKSVPHAPSSTLMLSEDEMLARALEESKKEADALRILEQKQLETIQNAARKREEAQRMQAERELQEALRLSSLSLGNQMFSVSMYEDEQLKIALELSSKEAELHRHTAQEQEELARALELSLQMEPSRATIPKKVVKDQPSQEALFALVAAQRNFGPLSSSSSSTNTSAETEEQKRRRVAREAAEKRAQTAKKR